MERRRANRLDGTVARSETGNVRGAAWESQWHLKRAKGAQTLFQRVRGCGAPNGYRVELTCRGCSNQTSIPVGCGQTTFCASCRDREIRETRLHLLARFEGLVDKARRAGLMSRKRRHQKGGRFGLRFVTYTAPHVGLPGARVEAMYRVWPRFNRMLRDALRPKLSEELTGVWLEKKDGELVEQTLWDFFQHQRVSEWTPGDDAFGHPHFHVLMFSPFIDQTMLRDLWTRAYNDVMGTRHAELIVHVRRTDGSLRSAIEEVCKYLIKDWELGAGRVAPDVMAQVYIAYDGRRRRQASAGLGAFALPIVKMCPCCQHENEGGHWARVRVTHTLSELLAGGARLPWAQGPPLVKAGEDLEISTYEWATGRAAHKHHDRWLESEAGRSFVERLRRETA